MRINAFTKWVLFLLTPIVKIYAGYLWWTLEPNDFSVLDFFTFKEGRDCWERSSIAASDAFNGGRSKRQYRDSPDATRKLAHGFDYSRRRLVEGSKTFRDLDALGWLTIWLPVI